MQLQGCWLRLMDKIIIYPHFLLFYHKFYSYLAKTSCHAYVFEDLKTCIWFYRFDIESTRLDRIHGFSNFSFTRPRRNQVFFLVLSYQMIRSSKLSFKWKTQLLNFSALSYEVFNPKKCVSPHLHIWWTRWIIVQLLRQWIR